MAAAGAPPAPPASGAAADEFEPTPSEVARLLAWLCSDATPAEVTDFDSLQAWLQTHVAAGDAGVVHLLAAAGAAGADAPARAPPLSICFAALLGYTVTPRALFLRRRRGRARR